MGNVNEPSVDSIPDAHEEGGSPFATESSSGESGQSDFTREMPGLLASFASVQRLQTTSDQGDLGSRPPSRVLIHGDDSSNVWRSFPDARVAQSPIEPTTNASTNPSDTSFPLSESDLPETFDTSMDPAELSDFFVNLPATNSEIADEGQMVPLPSVEAGLIKVAGSAHPIEFLMKDSDPGLPTSLSPSIVLPVSAIGCQRRKSILSRDAPTFVPKQKLSTMSEPFSRFESTVSVTLSSPVSVYSAVMDLHEAPTFRSADVGLPGTSAKPEHNVQASQSHEVVYPVVRIEEPRCSAPRLPEVLPLAVTTYADATNLAMQYPEYADCILTLPLPKLPQVASEEDKEQTTPRLPHVSNQEPIAEAPLPPLSPSLHHPDRPHWAAAALLEKFKTPETLTAPHSLGSSNANYAVNNSSSRSQRLRGNNSYSSIRTPHHESSGSRTPQIDDSGRHCDPPPHPRGAKDLEHLPHLGAHLIQRLSSSSNPWAVGSEGSNNDTGTLMSRTHDWTWGIGPAKAIASDTPSVLASTEHSDVGANHEMAGEWDMPDIDRVDLGPNATYLPPDGGHQQAPSVSSVSGSDRLGRHIISPHAISVNHESTRSVSCRVHKQQVADLNIAARRYLGEGSNRGSRRASSSASSNRSVEITGIVGASQAKFSVDRHLVHVSQVGDSIAQRSPPPSEATAAEKELTPMLRSGESPFREIQLRTNNLAPVLHRSPKASADPQIIQSISRRTKLHLSPHITSPSLEKHPAGHFSGTGSEWLAPPEHTIDDWLPPGSPRGPSFQNALSPSQILHFTNSLGVLLPPKYMSNSDHPVQHANVQHPFGLDPRKKDTSANWFREPAFTLPSAGNNGPMTGEQRTYPRCVRQSLPAQSEAFSQHLTEAYPSHSGNGGRKRRGRGRSARSVSSQIPQQRQHAYDSRYSFEAAPAPAIDKW